MLENQPSEVNICQIIHLNTFAGTRLSNTIFDTLVKIFSLQIGVRARVWLLVNQEVMGRAVLNLSTDTGTGAKT